MASVLRTLRHRKSPSELPSFDCIDLTSCSVGSDDSQSSWEDDEMLFNSRIPENFPLFRATYQRRMEARRSMLIKVCVTLFVVVTLFVNFSHTLRFDQASTRHHKHSMGHSEPNHSAARRLTRDNDQLMSLVDSRKIQEHSLTKVDELFGPGPYLVEFEVQIWGDDNRPEQRFFTVEMAPTVRTVCSILELDRSHIVHLRPQCRI